MRVLVIGESEPKAGRLRELLLQGDSSCSEVLWLSLASAADRVGQYRAEAIVLMLPADVSAGLAVLREIQEVVSTRIVVVGPAADAKLILRALQEGAYRYVDQDELDAEIPPAMRRLLAEAPVPDCQGRVIAVLGSGGGSGASTLAVNIATCLSRSHRTCALFDLRLETGDLATLLDLQPINTLADFCQNLSRMDQKMFEQCFLKHSSGVRLLSPARDFAEVKRITVRGVRKALSMARSSFPYVVLDLDHPFHEEQAQALFQSDVVLLVMRLDFTSLRQTRRILDHLKSLSIEGERVQLAVNRYRRPRELPVSEVEQALGMKVRYFVPDDPRAVNRANNSGVPVVLEKPRARISRTLADLSASLNGRHLEHE